MEEEKKLFYGLKKAALIEAVRGNIKNTEELRAFAKAYMKGAADQREKSFYKPLLEEREDIAEWIENQFMKNYYFTFGSDEKFPFHDGFIVVKADSIKEAARKFDEWYPNEMYEDTLNCSDYYSEKDWKKILEKGFYKNQSPLAVLK